MKGNPPNDTIDSRLTPDMRRGSVELM